MQVKCKLKGHTKRVTGLAFSLALNVLVSSGADAQVIISGVDMFPYVFLFNDLTEVKELVVFHLIGKCLLEIVQAPNLEHH